MSQIVLERYRLFGSVIDGSSSLVSDGEGSTNTSFLCYHGGVGGIEKCGKIRRQVW